MGRKSKKRQHHEKVGRIRGEQLKKQRRLEDAIRKDEHEEMKQRMRLAYHIDKHLTRVQGEIICKGEVR